MLALRDATVAPKRVINRRRILTCVSLAFACFPAIGAFAQGSALQSDRRNISDRITTTEDVAREHANSVVGRAQTFAATLTPEQRSKLIVKDTYRNLTNWSNLPEYAKSPHRVGLSTSTLSTVQWAALNALLRESTGSARLEGYDEVQQILNGDDYVHRFGSRKREGYGRSQYHVAFVGRPTTEGSWTFQFGGHHVAVINSYRDGNLIGVTPSFRGVDPLQPFLQHGVRNDPLGQEHLAFQTLLRSLTKDQLLAARLADKPSDIVLGPGVDWRFPTTPSGLSASQLSQGQAALLRVVIKSYTDDVSDEIAATLKNRYYGEIPLSRISFAGNSDLSEAGDYVRIEGPSFWMELIMDAPFSFPKPHVHTVWRDKHTDYGGRQK
ncbi:MAG: DUF3500 domain-containing protein [Rhodanobacter sp.]